MPAVTQALLVHWLELLDVTALSDFQRWKLWNSGGRRTRDAVKCQEETKGNYRNKHCTHALQISSSNEYILSSPLPSASPLSSPQEQIHVCTVAFLMYISLLWTHAGTSKTKGGLVKPSSAPSDVVLGESTTTSSAAHKGGSINAEGEIKKIMLTGNNGEALRNSKRGKCQWKPSVGLAEVNLSE